MAALIGVLWIPWTAQLTVVMWRIEGSSPVLTIIQLIGGALTAWVLMFCPAIWAVAAFRPDIEPNTDPHAQRPGLYPVQHHLCGHFGAGDRGRSGRTGRQECAIRVFPRWVSYWAIFAGLSFIPITAMPFYKTGPLAWNGVITFWALFGTYFIWTASMGVCMAKDASRRLREETETAPDARSRVA